ncbi:hypothetical protein CC78DRAFT_549688 [Lojkania enalia]|uniref:Uncharacterized protein n=1 Tax=Lojkania enalia TaxID=147567 RepID=A0A9P4JXX5_9PLEO|nr:hypothetical protein CC78DRAFT_549688 [Didymosphaeria enalia]
MASSFNKPLFPELTTPLTINLLANKGRGTLQQSIIKSDSEGGIDGLKEEDKEVKEAEDVEEEEEEEDDDEDEDEDQDHDEEDNNNDNNNYNNDYTNCRNTSVQSIVFKKKIVGSK